MTTRATLREEFTDLLGHFLRADDEAHLYRASELGRAMAEHEIAPEELVALHLEAIQRTVVTLPPAQVPSAVLRGYQLLLEAIMAYGLAYREFIRVEQRRRTEAESARQQIAQILETISDGFYAVDLQWRVTYVNHVAERLIGITRDGLVGQILWDVLPETALYRSALEGALAAQQPATFDAVANQSGSLYEIRAFPSATGLAVYFRDVTEQRRASAERARLQQHVEQERGTLASVMESMTEGILVCGEDGTVRYCNEHAATFLGCDVADVIGRSASEIFRGMCGNLEDQDTALALWRAALARVAERPSFDVKYGPPGQGDLTVAFFPLQGAEPQGPGFGVLLRDVSEERELERAKDELVSVVSHELRTPLASLVGFSELMLHRTFPEERQRQFLEIMFREGTRLTALVNDFLDVQRLEGGRLEVSLKAEAVRPMLARAAATLGDDDLRPFELDVPANVPPVLVDGDRLHQVLTNLLSNARKYSPRGGTVSVRACRRSDLVEVAVVDQGLGIPREALPRLFQKFYRVPGTDRGDIAGTGLGLVIVKRLVEAHGGTIWAESAGPGLGATFTFTLPIADDGGQGGEVLIVEDDASFALLLKEELRARGLTSSHAPNAQEALRLVAVHPPRAILLDLVLPGESGETLLPRLRGDVNVPVVVVTVKDLSAAEARALGVAAVVRKGPGVATRAATLVRDLLG